MVNEAVRRLISENELEERGGSEILYHFTSIEAVKSILQNNGENGGYFSMSRPNTVDNSILGREKNGKGNFTHYMSLTRSPNANWGYVKALDKSAFGRGSEEKNVSPNTPKMVGSARITFDGRRLSAGRVIKPIDFFDPYSDNGVKYDSNTQTKSGEWAGNDPVKKSMIKQAEDRLFGFTYDFDGILNFVTRIDLYAANDSGKYAASQVLKLAKGTPVEGKIHVYDDFRAFNRPDYDRIKSAAAKKQLSPDEWRPEINASLDDFHYGRKNSRHQRLIENAKLTNIAVFVWAVLFVEAYGGKLRKKHKVNENTKDLSFKFNSIFADEDVKKIIEELVKPVRAESYRTKISDLIYNAYKKLSNYDIAKYCFSANPKFEAMDGIARVLVNSIFDMAKRKFNFSTYKSLFTAAGNKMKEMWAGDKDVEAGKRYRDERTQRSQQKQRDKNLSTVRPEKIKSPVVKNGQRGRKAREATIPELSFKFPGVGKVVINDVTDAKDAIEKLSKLVPMELLKQKIQSIRTKVSSAKTRMLQPSLFNQSDIEEMVNECMRRLAESYEEDNC